MDEQFSGPQVRDPLADRRPVTRLLVFFALVYVVEGLGQVVGLISQPLNYYLKEAQGWTPVQITAFVTLFNLPWIIKPVYGLISDFVPLFGYRRKSYLLLANIAAIGGFLWVTQLSAPSDLLVALMITAYAMAISSTLCGAVLVENGQRLHESGAFVNQQWLWFNIAAMAAAFLGGQLVQHLSPGSALHIAALIIAVAPLMVIAGTLFLIPEQKVVVDIAGMKTTISGLIAIVSKAGTVAHRRILVSVLLQPRLEYAALFHHDRQPEILASLYRRARFDLGGWLGRGRTVVFSAVQQLDAQAPP